MRRPGRILVMVVALAIVSPLAIEFFVPGSLFLVQVEEEITGHGRVVRQAPLFWRDLWHGQWTSHYPSGEVFATGLYECRQGRVGLWQSFHSNGTQRSRVEYSQNRPIGVMLYWDEFGQPLPSLDYGTSLDGTYEVIEAPTEE